MESVRGGVTLGPSFSPECDVWAKQFSPDTAVNYSKCELTQISVLGSNNYHSRPEEFDFLLLSTKYISSCKSLNTCWGLFLFCYILLGQLLKVLLLPTLANKKYALITLAFSSKISVSVSI